MRNPMLADAVALVRSTDQSAMHNMLDGMGRDELAAVVHHVVFLAHGLAERDAEDTQAWLDAVLRVAEDGAGQS